MSDRIEKACMNCGALTHHTSDCSLLCRPTENPHEVNVKVALSAGWTEVSWDVLNRQSPRELREQKKFCRDTAERLCRWITDFSGNTDNIMEVIRQLPADERSLVFKKLTYAQTGKDIDDLSSDQMTHCWSTATAMDWCVAYLNRHYVIT